MAKKKEENGSIVISGTAEEISATLDKVSQMVNQKKTVIITSATIKEEMCNYGYEINDGPCTGDTIPNRKGSALIHNDMVLAFDKLNPHFAYLDDAFVHLPEGERPNTIEEIVNHIINGYFVVTGFKVSGTDENEGYILTGDKFVKHGTMSLNTPKITKSSGYVFFDELKEAIENARTEVYLYMNGKAAPKMVQGSLDLPDPDENNDDDFNNPM